MKRELLDKKIWYINGHDVVEALKEIDVKMDDSELEDFLDWCTRKLQFEWMETIQDAVDWYNPELKKEG